MDLRDRNPHSENPHSALRAPHSHLPLPLHLPEGLHYACVPCGRSCGEFLEIGVDPEYVVPIRAIPPAQLPLAQNPADPIVDSPWSPGESIMRLENGHCCMQQADGLCAIHAACGYAAKPPLCRDFPFKFIQTPAGTYVGLSFACTAVLRNAGPPVEERRAELATAEVSRHSRRVAHDPVALNTYIPLAWEQYAAIEADLERLLDPAFGQIGQRLVMQSVYLRLLIDFLRQARERAGAMAAGPEANVEALAVFHRRMREEGEGSLLSLVRRTAERRRTSPALRRSLLGFTHVMRTTYTRRMGRLASYLRATTQYFRFASGRAGVLALPGVAPVAYAALARVAFDPARPEFDELLTRYFRHRLFRKDLATADNLQTAHHMQLMHWGLIHWYAAALAAAAGAPAVELDHLYEAVLLIEKHYAMHSSFDKIFSRYPLLRGFMDRIFQNPLYAFSMGWGEWTENKAL